MSIPELRVADNSIQHTFKERNKKICIAIDVPSFDLTADLNIWIQIEPKSIRNSFDFIKKYYNYYDLILAWDKQILNFCPNSKRFIFGDCWIDISNFNAKKTNNISFLMSNKQHTLGHRLRHQIFDYLQTINNANYSILSIQTPPRINNKDIIFVSSKYSIIVENEKEPNWITEKLIDCLVTKTIPIYWGAPNIEEFFDMRGILVFDTLEELKYILDNINMLEYDTLEDTINFNKKEALKYANFFDRIEKEIDLL